MLRVDLHLHYFRPQRMLALADRIDIIETATASDSHSAEELGRSFIEMEEYSSPGDFLEKLRDARHVVTAASGTGRRA